MTPEERSILLQFMGQTYGEAFQNDQMLVGQSSNLKPKSSEIKQTFEEVLRSPVYTQPEHVPPPPQPAAVVVTLEQAVQELSQVEQPAQQEAAIVQSVQPVTAPTPQPVQPAEQQLEFDLSEPSKIDKLIMLIERQNLILTDIKVQLQSNGKTSKAKKTQRVP